MEQLKDLKKRLVCLVESQINGDLANVDAKELGEVMDMAKDCAETMYYCAVVDAMEKSTQEEKEFYMHEYAPETRFYTPMRGGNRMRMEGPMHGGMRTPVRYYTEPHDEDWEFRKRMYYKPDQDMWNNNQNQGHRDYREGKSPLTRRTYMELKENNRDIQTKTAQMDQYVKDLGEDWNEMATTREEKELLRQKLTTAISTLQ